MLVLEALAISPGFARGKLFMLGSGASVPVKTAISDPAAEWSRVSSAIEKVSSDLSSLFDSSSMSIGEEAAAIFEIHQMMLEDDDFIDSIRDFIENEQLNGEYAVYSTGNQFAAVFESSGSKVIRGRAADVRDLAFSIISTLRGDSATDLLSSVNEAVVVAAEELLPSQTVKLDKSLVLAFVCKRGSVNSHAAILARSLGIPAVCNLDDMYASLLSGDEVIVDGQNGLVVVRPDQEAVERYDRMIAMAKEDELLLERQRGLPAVTLDGFVVELCANIGHPDEVEAAISNDADGVGLFRSEFLYFDCDDFPTEEVQFEAYKTVIEAFAPKRVVVRTLDFGADKQAPYFDLPAEENPALGYRAIRICLDRPEIFEPQIRALLRASVYGKLAIMFPMITCVDEVLSVIEFIDKIKIDLDGAGIKYAEDIELGVMIETPAAVAIAPELAEIVDFFSVGTNDLTQYTMAADRMNQKVSYLHDSANPAVLRFIRQAADAAHDAGIWIGICGESAADVELLPFYISIGIDELSMSPHSILKVKNVVRGLGDRPAESEEQ